MQCFNPIKIKLSDEARAKRVAAEYMPLDWRFATSINVPCGKCAACLSRRRSQWSMRLFNEVRNSDTCYFITLTYNDEHLNYKFINDDGEIIDVPVVCKRDVQLFLKRLRKKIEPFKIRYFLVSEYGPKTFRPHYHMLLFNFPHLLKNKLDEYLLDAWNLGFIRVDPVTDARVNYVTSYCLDSSTLPAYLDKNFMLCSRRPGLGASYLDDDRIVAHHVNNLDDQCCISSYGKVTKVKMPRFYSDKLFSDEQRHQINDKVAKFHAAKRSKLDRKQRSWLLKKGIEPTDVNMQTAFPDSPLWKELLQEEEFTRKVEKKCKMKKNG